MATVLGVPALTARANNAAASRRPNVRVVCAHQPAPAPAQAVKRAALVQVAGAASMLGLAERAAAAAPDLVYASNNIMDLADSGNGALATVRTVSAALTIGIILIQTPNSDEAAESLTKGGMASMKSSANFLNYTTWGLIATFMVSSGLLAAN